MYGLTCKLVLLPMDLTAPGIHTPKEFQIIPNKKLAGAPISDHSTVAVDGAMVLQPAGKDFGEEETILTEQIACCQKWLDDFIVEETDVGLTKINSTYPTN